MNTSIYIEDSDIFKDLKQALQFFSGSVNEVLDAINIYLDNVSTEIDNHVEIIRQLLEVAKEREVQAKEARDAAKERWEDSLRSVELAENEFNDANDILNELDY